MGAAKMGTRRALAPWEKGEQGGGEGTSGTWGRDLVHHRGWGGDSMHHEE